MHEVMPNFMRGLTRAAPTFVKWANTYCTSVELANRVEHCERSRFILLHFGQDVTYGPHTSGRGKDWQKPFENIDSDDCK